jgi:hypothetical protein
LFARFALHPIIALSRFYEVLVRQVFLLSFLLLIFISVGTAQRGRRSITSDGNPPGNTDPQFGQRRNQRDPLEQQAERDRAKQLNKERQATLKRDTDKLLELATELKQYVDKTNENVLSLEVLKKAEQIEKLAHSVKEKMKD